MNTMKKIMTIAIVVAGIVAVTGFAQTTTDSGTLNLTGTVPKIVNINVVADPAASSLDLTQDATDLLVATVTETSNVQAGYTVTVESANAAASGTDSAFFDSSASGNTDTLDYSLSYGGSAVSFSGGAAAVLTDASDKTAASGVTNEVRIAYTAKHMYNGTYEDTLTFTIQAK